MLLVYLWAAFKLWMLVDAIQSGVHRLWYFPILFVPGGAIAYFVVEKGPSLGLGSPLALFQRPVSTSFLRHAYRENPCLENAGRLAARLHDDGDYAEALELYQRVSKRDEGSLRARFGSGLCQLALGRCSDAAESFRAILDRDRAYAGFEVWSWLATALEQRGDRDGAIESLEELVRASPRIDHVVVLCRALAAADRGPEAHTRLSEALEDFQHAPRHVRRRARPAAKEASKLLGALAA